MLFIMHSPLMVWFYRQRWRVAKLPIDWLVSRLRWRTRKRRIARRIRSQRERIGVALLPVFARMVFELDQLMREVGA